MPLGSCLGHPFPATQRNADLTHKITLRLFSVICPLVQQNHQPYDWGFRNMREFVRRLLSKIRKRDESDI